MRVSILSASRLAIATLVLGACSAAPPPASPVQGEPAVKIVDFGFNPKTLTVAAGTRVTWTNTGATAHTVTFDDGTDSGAVADGGGTYERTLDAAGTHEYHCSFHPSMRAAITVE